jgi:pimeloyl-ACP methyl ester carboxylesterase
MAPPLVLIHSPLVGPMTWQPVSDFLEGCGNQTICPDLSGSLGDGPPYWPRQADAIARAAGARTAILVAHSGAGPLLPAGGQRAGQVAGYLFVDAALPHPGQNWFESVPAELGQQLRSREHDGWLPPWPEWWSPEELLQLLPDRGPRERFVADCQRLPIALFEEKKPKVSGWPDAPCGYLQLSSAYDLEAAAARKMGWRTIELESHHLGMLTEPERISEALLSIARQLL